MQNNACEAVYDQRYSIHDVGSGLDVSNSMPNYLIDFDENVPQVTLYSNQIADLGIKTIMIKSNIVLSPNDRVSDSYIILTLDIIGDECLRTVVYPATLDPVPSDNTLVPSVYPDLIQDMSFNIWHGMQPVVQVIPEATDTVGTCGDILYTISVASGSTLTVGSVTLDSFIRTITVETNSGVDVGTYYFVIRADL